MREGRGRKHRIQCLHIGICGGVPRSPIRAKRKKRANSISRARTYAGWARVRLSKKRDRIAVKGNTRTNSISHKHRTGDQRVCHLIHDVGTRSNIQKKERGGQTRFLSYVDSAFLVSRPTGCIQSFPLPCPVPSPRRRVGPEGGTYAHTSAAR